MSTIVIPTLRTPRLLLRAFREEDLGDYAAMLGNPEVVRHLGDGRPRDLGATWMAMARGIGQWGLRGYGMFAVQTLEGAFVGHVGVLHPAHFEEPEIAYALTPGMQGRGFATEAAQAVRVWAARTRGILSPVSYIRAENRASIAVATRLGAVREGEVELAGAPALRFRHVAPADAAPVIAGAALIEMPTLHTKRLRIRGFTEGDFPALCAIHADAEVMRYLGDGLPRGADATWGNMAMSLGGFGLRSTGYLAVTEAATGVLVGRAGVIDTPDWPGPELGYTFARAAWGKGYATEAAGAIRDWAWRALKPRSLESYVKVGNVASGLVAAKLGAVMEGVFDFEGKACERWVHARP